MPWVRMDTGMKNDPSIWRIASDVKRDVGAVVGYVMNLFGELPEHARTGDLSSVPDDLLERWAMWPGKRGAFARAFVAHLCEGRQVRSWEKHNGAALREADRTRDRVRAFRDRQRNGGHATAAVTPTTNGNASGNGSRNAERNALRNDLTDTDTDTGRNGEKKQGRPAVADAPAPAPSAPPAPRTDPPAERPAWLVLHTEWQQRIGPIDKARFRKAFRPLCEPGEGTPLPYPVAVLRTALEWYAATRRGTREWGFIKPETFVSGVTEHVRIARMDMQDRVRLLPLPAGAA